jgi:Tol biopolymer transport system component
MQTRYSAGVHRVLKSAVALAATAPLAATAALVQLTPGGDRNSLNASVSDDGQRVVFYSASDLTGANGDRNFEVFLYERGTDTLRQISNDPSGIFSGSQTAQISGDGTRIVYQHFQPAPNNTVAFQTVAYDIASASFTTLTQPGAFQMSDISRDGSKISVNVDNLGLRIFDTATGSFSAALAGSVIAHSLSGNGQLVSFATFGGGIGLLDASTGAITTILQDGAFGDTRPAISADGTRVAFTSTRNLLGQNADGNAELFLYDVGSASLRQLTNTTGGNARSAAISVDGRRIAFSSFSDPLGLNGDLNEEIFYYDLDDGLLAQATQTSGSQLFNFEPTLSADGATLAFTSNRRAGGGGNGPMQIFLQDLPPLVQGVPEPPTLALVASLMLALVRRPRARTSDG